MLNGPDVTSDPRFDRLAQLLDGDDARALGALHFLVWHVTSANSETFADVAAVELAARWRGAPGELASMLGEVGYLVAGRRRGSFRLEMAGEVDAERRRMISEKRRQAGRLGGSKSWRSRLEQGDTSATATKQNAKQTTPFASSFASSHVVTRSKTRSKTPGLDEAKREANDPDTPPALARARGEAVLVVPTATATTTAKDPPPPPVGPAAVVEASTAQQATLDPLGQLGLDGVPIHETEKRTKAKASPKLKPELVIPAELEAMIPDIRERWAARIASCRANARPTVSAQSKQLAAALRWIDVHGLPAVLDSIERATNGGYQGLPEPRWRLREQRRNGSGSAFSPPHRPRSAEELDAIARWERGEASATTQQHRDPTGGSRP